MEFTPNKSLRDKLIAGPFRKFEDWANFEKTETGTRVTFGLDYELSGSIFYRILDILVVRRRVRQQGLEAMKRAKEILERQ